MKYSITAVMGDGPGGVAFRIQDDQDNLIATCYGGENARHVVDLMNLGEAAADLLAACKAMVQMYVKLGMDTPSMPGFEITTVQTARAAIAKAEGR